MSPETNEAGHWVCPYAITTSGVFRDGVMADDEVVLYSVADYVVGRLYAIDDSHHGDPPHRYECVRYFCSGQERAAAVSIYRRLPEADAGLPAYVVEIQQGEDDEYFGADSLHESFLAIALVMPTYMIR